jgi:hypothetical protein
MSEENKQAATEEADAQAKTGAEETGAQDKKDDLDTLLAEYEEGTGPSTEQKQAEKTDPNVERLERLERTLNERDYRDDMKLVVGSVRGEFTPDEVDDEFIDTWVNAEAKKDPRVAQAWMKRHDDPQKFQRVVAGLSRKFAEKHAKIRQRDEDATADRESVAHAVRGASNKAPEGKAPDYTGQSDNEFRKSVEEKYGFTPL